MTFHSPQICLVLDFGLTTFHFPSSPLSLSRLWNPTYHVKALVVVGVCGGDRSSVTQLSFVASPQGHWPVKKYPWNHETMRVITHSGVTGGPLMEVLDLKHPSSTRNIKEPRFKIGEPWTTLGNSEKRQQYKCGVPRMDKHVAGLCAKKGAVKKEQKKNARTKKRPVGSIPFYLKTMVKLMRWPYIFFWLITLLFSLCPESASSQVRDASKKLSRIGHWGPANLCV